MNVVAITDKYLPLLMKEIKQLILSKIAGGMSLGNSLQALVYLRSLNRLFRLLTIIKSARFRFNDKSYHTKKKLIFF